MLDSPLVGHRGGYLGGVFLPVGEEPSFCVHDPATGELLAELPSYGAETTLQMVAAAEAALFTPTTIEQRAAWLLAITEALLANRAELGRIISLENGKPLAEAEGEVEYAAGFYRAAAHAIDRLRPRTLAARPKGLRWTVYARPAGVAGLITPWNFPLAMLAKKLAGAIAAGAPSVVKPAEKTPLSCLAFFHLLDRLGLPPGLVNLVFGDAPAIGQVLCEHPAVRVISFTGSTRVGKLLASQAAPHLKRLALELGGNAPFIVFEDADLDLAVAQLMASKFRCSGQTCVSANRIYLHEQIAAAFTERLVGVVGALKVGRGIDPGVQVGPLIDAAAVAKVRRLVEDAVQRGAQLAVGALPPPPAVGAASHFYPPTVLTGVLAGMRILEEEAFGPVVPLTTFATEREVLQAANQTEHGLAAYLFTERDRGERLAAALHFGHVAINSGTGPTPEAPFGGMKQSGYGREGGDEGLLEFVEMQTVPSN